MFCQSGLSEQLCTRSEVDNANKLPIGSSHQDIAWQGIESVRYRREPFAGVECFSSAGWRELRSLGYSNPRWAPVSGIFDPGLAHPAPEEGNATQSYPRFLPVVNEGFRPARVKGTHDDRADTCNQITHTKQTPSTGERWIQPGKCFGCIGAVLVDCMSSDCALREQPDPPDWAVQGPPMF
jgi:hypothetical protein